MTEWPRIKDLPEAERKGFARWLDGRTRPFVPGIPDSEQDFYFPWDYRRWKYNTHHLDD